MSVVGGSLAVILLVVVGSTVGDLPQALCPIHCHCFFEGTVGTVAKCLALDAEKQMFPRNVEKLSIENAPPITLPANIFTKVGLEKITVVKIVNTTILDLDANAFKGLEDLRTVELVNTRLPLVHPNTFRDCPKLKTLSLAKNPLQLTQVLSSTVHYFLASDSLEELILSGCQLGQLTPDTFGRLHNLDMLDLSQNRLSSISPGAFSGLELEVLDLSHNAITELPEDVFADLEELVTLNIQGNPIETLIMPPMPDLKELYASDCRLSRLDLISVDNTPQLTQLNLSGNSIEYIDVDAMDALPMLKYLDLSRNSLTGPLDPELFSFNEQLETVSLRHNPLGSLGPLKGEFQWMFSLDISSCDLRSLSHSSLNGTRYLTILNASRNHIQHLDPATLTSLTQLNVLDLSHNRLSSLPANVFAFNSQLTKLYLSGNMLRHLPAASLRPLKKLRYLDASQNQLRRLWNVSEAAALDEGSCLLSLVELDLRSNKMSHLSASTLMPLRNLRILRIEDNPIECRPPLIKAIEWLSVQRVLPSEDRVPIQVMGSSGGVIGTFNDDLLDSHVRWGAVVDELCPRSSERLPHLEHIRLPTVVGEPPLLSTTFAGGRWSSIAVTLIACVIAVVNISLYLYARSRRQRHSAFGGLPHRYQMGRSPAYQKLYEECSVPNPIVRNNKKLSIISTFTHTSNGPVQAV